MTRRSKIEGKIKRLNERVVWLTAKMEENQYVGGVLGYPERIEKYQARIAAFETSLSLIHLSFTDDEVELLEVVMANEQAQRYDQLCRRYEGGDYTRRQHTIAKQINAKIKEACDAHKR